MRLRDFQIYPAFFEIERGKLLAEAAFPVYEAARLDLKRRRPTAPFQKIVISLREQSKAGRPETTCALGICETTVLVDSDALIAALPATQELVAAARAGLESIQRDTGFSDAQLLTTLMDCAERDPPCDARLDRFSRRTRRGTACDLYLSARFRDSRVEVAFSRSGREVGRVALKTMDGPLFFEHDFPAHRSRVRAGYFEVLARDGSVLASALIPKSVPGRD